MIGKYINKLEKSTNKQDAIDNLKEIGKLIISNYIIKIDKDSYIIPLWIEAYCYIDNVFEDDTCDRNCAQYGKDTLNFNKVGNKRRIRVDIVPNHNSSFALSYLLKVGVLVKKNQQNKMLIQSEIANRLFPYKNKKSVSLKLIQTQTMNSNKIAITKRQFDQNCKKIFKDEELGFYLKSINPKKFDYKQFCKHRKK